MVAPRASRSAYVLLPDVFVPHPGAVGRDEKARSCLTSGYGR
jgi:hypothetical protein